LARHIKLCHQPSAGDPGDCQDDRKLYEHSDGLTDPRDQQNDPDCTKREAGSEYDREVGETGQHRAPKIMSWPIRSVAHDIRSHYGCAHSSGMSGGRLVTPSSASTHIGNLSLLGRQL